MDKAQIDAITHMSKKIIEEDENFFYRTKDPTSPLGPNSPALTTLMFKVCDNDPIKFEEACRLIKLFVEDVRANE